MRIVFPLAASLLALLPGLAMGDKPMAVGVGEISCDKPVEQALCAELTERLVATLQALHEVPVVRQSEALDKQKSCKQDPACLAKARVSYGKLVSGTVRVVENERKVSLRMLDAKRMKKLGEATEKSETLERADLLVAIEAAARRLPK